LGDGAGWRKIGSALVFPLSRTAPGAGEGEGALTGAGAGEGGLPELVAMFSSCG